jgi:hypothetical protein
MTTYREKRRAQKRREYCRGPDPHANLAPRPGCHSRYRSASSLNPQDDEPAFRAALFGHVKNCRRAKTTLPAITMPMAED